MSPRGSIPPESNEGHGFLNPDNRLALYHTMDRFFAQYLGGRTQAKVSADVEARIRGMTVDVDTLKPVPERRDRAAGT
jgi:hypothetical protein